MTDLLLTHGYVLADDPAERHVMKPYPPLGILYISAYLKSKGFAVDVLDPTFSGADAFTTRLAEVRPRIVGISANLFTRRRVLRMAREAKAAGAIVVLGGPEPIHYAAEYLARDADVIVAGEGELAMERLLPHLRTNGLRDLQQFPGIAFRGRDSAVTSTGPGPTVADLDALPVPDREAIDIDAYVACWRAHHGMGAVSLITARGCPFTCTWCSHGVYGFTHRRRSPEQVADELELIVERYRPDLVWYADDVFTINRHWIFRYRAELERRGLRVPFETITREDRLDEDVVRALAAMGCLRLWVGAESGSQRVLDAMKRGTSAARMRDMIGLLRRHGIESGTFVMLGYDGEELSDLDATLEHLKAATPDLVLTTSAYPIKGTEYERTVADRVVATAPWEESSDRDLTVAGRRSDAFYRFATRWLVSEVTRHRQRQDGTRYARRLKTFVNAKIGRLGMLLTQNTVVHRAPRT